MESLNTIKRLKNLTSVFATRLDAIANTLMQANHRLARLRTTDARDQLDLRLRNAELEVELANVAILRSNLTVTIEQMAAVHAELEADLKVAPLLACSPDAEGGAA